VVRRLGAVVLVLASCGDEATSAGEGTTGGETSSGSPTSFTASVGSSESSLDGSTSDASDESGVAETGAVALEYAHGIRLERLAANQGVQIELATDGVAVDPAQHTATFVEGRRTIVRAFWSLHADFVPRELVGRLIVTYTGGEEVVLERTEMVDEPSVDNGPSFQWLLEAEDVRAGMTLRAQALEPDPALAAGEVSDPPPIVPYAAAVELPMQAGPMELQVVLVPVLHQLDGCEQAPMPTESDVVAITQALEQTNPVQAAIVTVGDPMPYTASIGMSMEAFSPVLAELAMRREADAPEPNVYYYGLMDSCDGYPPGLLGQAIAIPEDPLPELGHERVSTGRWQGSGAAASETLVHEVGHCQGRRHVVCSGGEGGPDLAYPHENGRIGVWGFGIHDYGLRSPTAARDYMTYCSDEWVSDYGWEQTREVIGVLTSWDYDDDRPGDGRVLAGVIHASGGATWWTAKGGVVGESDGATIVWTIEGVEIETPALVRAMPDGPGTYVVSALPEGAAGASDLRVEIGGQAARAIAPGAVRGLVR
jgi:hypothetical protein